MTTPTFTKSAKFLGEYELPCLVAEMKNSDVPEVAKKYVAGSSDDSVFEVYLRVKKPEAMSPWMQQKLEELFERDGLTKAIAEGLKELDADGYDFLLEHERDFVKTHGYHPYVYIKEIVLDEIKEKVLISLGDDSVLNEHGITIHLKAGRWRFADGDLFGRYQSAFEKYLPKAGLEEWKKEWEKWHELFPEIIRGRFEKDCSMIFGRWVLDQRETDQLCKELEWDAFEINPDQELVISETEIWGLDGLPSVVTSLKRRGNWITVGVEWWDALAKKNPNYKGFRCTFRFWCDGRRLMNVGTSDRPPSGAVYIKVAAAKHA